MKSLRLTAVAAVTVLALTGCGGSDGDSDDDNAGGGDGTSSTPSDDQPTNPMPKTVDTVDTCALLSADELSEATGADYGDGVSDGYGQCVWRVGGAPANNGDGQLVVAVQEAELEFIKSIFTGGVDTTAGDKDAYWNPDEGLQSLWVDIGDGQCLVLSFDPVDDGTQAIAEEVGGIAVGHMEDG